MPATRYVTFMDFPSSDDGKNEEGTGRSHFAFMGAPMDSGAGERPGARYGPDAIRRAPYLMDGFYSVALDVYPTDDLEIVDTGDAQIWTYNHAQNLLSVYTHAKEVVPNTDCLGVMGGDHSVLMSTFKAVQEHHGDVTLIHFDAHADVWEGEKHETHTHGNPIRRLYESGILKKCLHVGVRGFGPSHEEFEWAQQRGSVFYSADTIWQVGAMSVLDDVLSKISPDEKVYVSVDIDVLDPSVAPATGTPEPGGMTSRELLWMIRTIAEKRNVVAVDVVELAPVYDHAEISAIVANRVFIETLCGIAKRTVGSTHRSEPELP